LKFIHNFLSYPAYSQTHTHCHTDDQAVAEKPTDEAKAKIRLVTANGKRIARQHLSRSKDEHTYSC